MHPPINTLIIPHTDGLLQTFITILHLIHKDHGLISLLVRKRSTVLHQISIHERTDQIQTGTICSACPIPVSVIQYAQGLITNSGKHNLRSHRLHTDKQIPVRFRRTVCRIQFKTRVSDHILCRFNRLVQPSIRRLFQPIFRMILTERPLEQAYSRLESLSYILRDQGTGLITRQGNMLASEIQISQDRIHHQGSRIPCRIQIGVIHLHRLIDPRHVAKAFHLIKVEPSTEETS